MRLLLIPEDSGSRMELQYIDKTLLPSFVYWPQKALLGIWRWVRDTYLNFGAEVSNPWLKLTISGTSILTLFNLLSGGKLHHHHYHSPFLIWLSAGHLEHFCLAATLALIVLKSVFSPQRRDVSDNTSE